MDYRRGRSYYYSRFAQLVRMGTTRQAFLKTCGGRAVVTTHLAPKETPQNCDGQGSGREATFLGPLASMENLSCPASGQNTRLTRADTALAESG